MEEGRLKNYMIQNHWFVVRPTSQDAAWRVPQQGWGTSVWGQDGRWTDDRQWGAWRSIMRGLGGDFAEWADVDWSRVDLNQGKNIMPHCPQAQPAPKRTLSYTLS